MARKRIDMNVEPEVEQTEIDAVAEAYIDAKAKEKDIKATTSALNKKLKDYFEEADSHVLKVENGSVKFSYREQDVFDEESLIELFKRYPEASGIVRTKEYVDYGELESALYNDKLPDECVEQIQKHKSVKRTAIITVGK